MKQTEQKIYALLTAAFTPDHLHVEDESWRHAGHAGASSGGGHFVVEISANALKDISRIAAHRMIHESLGELFPRHSHALSIHIQR